MDKPHKKFSRGKFPLTLKSISVVGSAARFYPVQFIVGSDQSLQEPIVLNALDAKDLGRRETGRTSRCLAQIFGLITKLSKLVLD
jgi:hypothetical protein